MGWLLLLLLLLLAAVIVTSLMSHIQGHVYFSRRDDNDTLWLDARALFGLIRYKYQVPVIRFRGLFGGITLQTDLTKGEPANPSTAEERRITKDKIVEFYTNMRLLTNNIVGFGEWAKDAMSRTKCSELRWETKIGAGDAPETAVTTGMIWGLKSSLLGFAFSHINLLTKPKIVVYPEYNKILFTTELSCIVKIRVGNAIIAGLLLLVRILKVKGGLRTWQSILFKA